jgi:hemerythrin
MTVAVVEDSIVWTDDFLIGIEELDYEHRVLIEDINKLHLELREQVDIDLIEDTLGSIHARIQAHFALEESVMQAREYVHFAEHKAEHDLLLDEYTRRMIEFRNDQNADDRDAMEAVLRSWIVDHIVHSDKKMSRMIRPSDRA